MCNDVTDDVRCRLDSLLTYRHAAMLKEGLDSSLQHLTEGGAYLLVVALQQKRSVTK